MEKLVEKPCQSGVGREIKGRISRIKDLFRELLRLLETEGGAEVDYAKKELQRNVLMIEKVLSHRTVDFEKVFGEVKASYHSMYPPHGGLIDFFVWRDDFEERVKANQPLDNVKDELKIIMDMEWGPMGG